MRKKGFIIGIILCVAVASVVAVVVINRNTAANVSTGSADGPETAMSSEQSTAAILKEENGQQESADTVQEVEKLENGMTAEMELTGASKESVNDSAQAGSETSAGESPSQQPTNSVGDISNGQNTTLESERGEIELPAETDFPEDWDWEHIPVESKTPATSVESTEASSTEEGTESTEEDVTEKSGEETSPAESSSEEEGSTEETEPETTTLSPEEQASIVESATAPIELPPIFFN